MPGLTRVVIPTDRYPAVPTWSNSPMTPIEPVSIGPTSLRRRALNILKRVVLIACILPLVPPWALLAFVIPHPIALTLFLGGLMGIYGASRYVQKEPSHSIKWLRYTAGWILVGMFSIFGGVAFVALMLIDDSGVSVLTRLPGSVLWLLPFMSGFGAGAYALLESRTRSQDQVPGPAQAPVPTDRYSADPLISA